MVRYRVTHPLQGKLARQATRPHGVVSSRNKMATSTYITSEPGSETNSQVEFVSDNKRVSDAGWYIRLKIKQQIRTWCIDTG